MKNAFFEYVTDNTKSLDDVLTKSYDLKELLSFFSIYSINETIGKASYEDADPLLFSEVDQYYPVEVFRSKGYTVYKVKQGGYFYVFWVMPIINNSSKHEAEPTVYFSAYIRSNKSYSDFEFLQNGHRTAKDLEAIDPYFELSFLMSNGIFSYSFLNDETILQVEYSLDGEYKDYESLIVKRIIEMPRQQSPSVYSSILSIDIP